MHHIEEAFLVVIYYVKQRTKMPNVPLYIMFLGLDWLDCKCKSD